MVPRYLSRTSSATPLPPPPQTGQPWAQEEAQSGEELGFFHGWEFALFGFLCEFALFKVRIALFL